MWIKRHLPCTISGRRTGISYHIHCRTDIHYFMGGGGCRTDISCLMGGLQGRYQLSHGGLQNRYQLYHGELYDRHQLSHGGTVGQISVISWRTVEPISVISWGTVEQISVISWGDCRVDISYQMHVQCSRTEYQLSDIGQQDRFFIY